MCGIVGVVDWVRTTNPEDVNRMLVSLRHRGPDDSGNYHVASPHADLWMGHARLSIIDLSPAGHQPMHFGDWTIVFNGEIYNYESIRDTLSKLGHQFNSHSDTEVILHSFQEWGEECVHHFRGMFAFAIYNKQKEKIWLFRDRVGVKPLYYYHKDNRLLFASELKALLAHPAFKKDVDPASVYAFLQRGYISAPQSIYRDTYKVLPGSFLEIDLVSGNTKSHDYWRAINYFVAPKLSLGYSDAKNLLREKLEESSRLRMVADVPVGVFLSGGYDSTAVTAALQKSGTQKLKTFTIGFEQGVNEAPAAKRVAEFLETDHTEYYCTYEEARAIIPELPHFYDEPFADSSAIPTILVSRMAREQVTVALSADGGDELFAGYERYRSFDKYVKQVRPWQRTSAGVLIRPFLSMAATILPRANYSLNHKLKEMNIALKENKSDNMSRLFLGMGALAEDYLADAMELKSRMVLNDWHWSKNWPELDAMDAAMATDINTYLVEDILTKIDRAAMSCSLEGREPLLDHTLIEFAAQLPVEYKFDGVTTKKILKDLVHDWVPSELMNRPKAGFSLPINKWLKTDLRYLLDRYLSAEALARSGVFRVDFVLKQRSLFESGKLHYTVFIWRVLMFQMWYEKWISPVI